MVLTLLKTFVELKLKKGAFFTNQIENLGHVLKQIRLHVSSYTADAIRELKEPIKVTELCSLLGIFSVFKRSVFNFERIPSLLSKQHKKSQKRSTGLFSYYREINYQIRSVLNRERQPWASSTRP